MFFYFYNLKSITATVLFEKLAATLLPSLFQHTSKIPPSPWNVFTSCPSSA
jgi:hypothetical protein